MDEAKKREDQEDREEILDAIRRNPLMFGAVSLLGSHGCRV